MAMAGPGVGEDCDVVFGCESDVFLSMFVGDPDSNKSSMVGEDVSILVFQDGERGRHNYIILVWFAACSEGRCRAKLPALRCCFAFGKVSCLLKPDVLSGRIKLEIVGIRRSRT